MSRKPTDRIARLVSEAEDAAKRLRADVRKRAKERPLLRSMEKAVARLRKRAASTALQVEKALHEIRVGLSRPPSKPAPKRRKAAASPRRRRVATAS